MDATTHRADGVREAAAPVATGASMRRVAGTLLRVQDIGPRDGTPVLLVNGSAANLEVTARFVDELARTRRVVTFDQPGMGRSPATWPTLAVPGLAGLALALLDDLGIERADIIGYSFGGAVAQQVAIAAPRRVGRLVLLAAVYGAGGVPTDPVSAAAVLAHASPGGRWCRGPARRAYGGGVLRREDEMRAFERAIGVAPPDAGSFLGQAVAASTWSALPWLWAIRAPTLVLSGDEDLVVPLANARVLAALIPGARFEVLAGEGHLVVLDTAAATAERIEAFLAESQSQPATSRT